MKGIELKPCPFCGGEAQIKAAVKKDVGLFTIWVECGKCSAKTEGYCPNMKNEDRSIDDIAKCTELAIERWNQRAGDTP